MTIEKHQIVDRESWLDLRRQDVTASAIAALAGDHPYTTKFELHAEKTGKFTPDFDATGAQERGLDLEPSFVRIAKRHRPEWRLTANQFYFRDPVARIGATPDFDVAGDERGFGLLQAKTVAPDVYRRNWLAEDETIEPPLWVCLQLATEMMLTGATWGAIAVLVVDRKLTFEIVEQERHEGAEERIRELVAEFWSDVAAGRTPSPDYARDGDVIASMYRRGGAPAVDLSQHNRIAFLCEERLAWQKRKTNCEKALDVVDAEIRDVLRDADEGKHPDFKLTNKLQRRKEFTAPASEFRVLRITRRNAKPEEEAA